MRRGPFLYALLLTLLLIPATSFAARYRGAASSPAPYLSFFLGVSAPTDTEVSGIDFAGPTPFSEEVEFDPSINVGGTAGFDFGLFRLEGELSYKHGEIDTVTTSGGERFVDGDGRVGALSLLVNGFFDVETGTAVTPYFGGGVGFAAIHLSDTFGINSATGVDTLLYFSDDDTVFAYQAGGGLAITLTPMMTLDIGYRYFGTSEASFDETPITTEFELESHNVAVGLRFTF